jgi:hypothetical protein
MTFYRIPPELISPLVDTGGVYNDSPSYLSIFISSTTTI